MDYQFPLCGGGSVTLQDRGAELSALARLPDDGRGLYKIYLTGDSGRYLLGTPIPEQGTLLLRRVVCLDSLRRQGAWPPTGAQAVLAYPAGGAGRPEEAGWHPEPCPQARMSDPVLRRASSGLSGTLIKREPDGFSLAFPWSSGCRFPLPPLFCLARIASIGCRCFAVFSFNDQGIPRVPSQGSAPENG